MRGVRVACATLGLGLLGALPGAFGARATDALDRMSRTVALTASHAVRVDATVADVTIAASDRADMAVEIVRRAPTAADLVRFPAVIEETGETLRIAALQAGDGRDARLKADIRVQAPAVAQFDAVRVFEGQVRVTGLRNGCDVDVRRGRIEATAVAGRVRLESGVGSIDVRDPSLTHEGMLRLRVFNGPILVSFDRTPPDARILALTFNGSIASDIPLAMKDKFGPRFGEATLGAGKPVMSIDVVTGDITIRVRR
jgi:hypothetical protein